MEKIISINRVFIIIEKSCNYKKLKEKNNGNSENSENSENNENLNNQLIKTEIRL